MSEIKKTFEKTEEIARKIWLAGLGAYGQGIDNMTSGYGKVNSETKSLFEKLVSRGEELENLTLKTIKETRDQAVNRTNSTIRAQGEILASQGEKLASRGEKLKSQAEKIQGINVEDLSLDKLALDKLNMESISDRLSETINSRLDEIRNRVNDIIPTMVTRDDIAELSEKIDQLAAKPKTRTSRAKKSATETDATDPKEQ